jgi:hypothetical protein
VGRIQRVKSVCFSLVCLCSLLMGATEAIYAQSATGIITGNVTDSSGAVIPNATITITHTATGAVRSLATNGSGLFNASALEAGQYQVRCEQTGFQVVERAAEVQAGSSTTVNFVLALGRVSQEVKVVAGATAEMNYESHSVAGVIAQQSIENLPMNGRNFVQLGSLQPGVTVSTHAQGIMNAAIGITVLGGGGQYPLVTMDGLQINDYLDGSSGGGTAINFSTEVVQEFQLSSANFDLSTPTTMQGAVNMVTRSGGNDFHGGVYFFYRDHNMAAYPGLHLNPFNPNPYFVRKNPGFVFSGPIVKNKLFFFGNYEYTGQASAVAVQPDLASIQPAAGIFTSPFSYNYTTVRLDYEPSQKLSTFLRWTQDRNNGLGVSGITGTSAFPSDWVSLYNWSEQYALGITTIFTPNLVGDFRFGFRDWHNIETVPSTAQCGNPCLGGAVPDLAPAGLPQLSMIGSSNWTSGNNSEAYQNRLARDYEPQYTLSWQKGVHSLKFGYDLDYVNIVWSDAVCQNGCMSVYSVEDTKTILGPLTSTYLPNLPTTVTTNADLLNLPISYPTGSFGSGFNVGPAEIPGPYNFEKERKMFRHRWYAEDHWKMRPNLTVNYGLAYALEQRLFPNMPIPGLYGPVYGLAPGTTQPPTPTNKFDFSPAFGFAYSPGNSGRMVIRGGAGVYWDTNNFSAKSHAIAIDGPVGNGPLVAPSTLFTNIFPGIIEQGPNGTFPVLPIGAQIPTSVFTNLTLQQFLEIYNQQYTAINSRFELSSPIRSGPYQYSNMDLVKQAPTAYNAHFPLPRSYQTSIGIQRQMGGEIVLTADWVQRDVQQNSLGSPDLNRFTQYINGVNKPIVPKCTNAQLFVLGQQCSTGGFTTNTNGGRALYEGLLVSLNKRLSHHYQFAVSYALQNFNSETIVNNNNYWEGYGPTIAHQNLNISGIGNLPWGFSLSLNSSIISRTPVEVETTTIDLSGSGAVSSGPLPGIPVRGLPSRAALAKAVAAFNAQYAGTHAPNGAVIPTYVLPPSYQPAGLPQISQDFRLTKTFNYRERYHLAFYGEVFNSLNIANLTGYSENLDEYKATGQTFAFGQPTTRAGQVFLSSGPRAEQVGTRFTF